MRDNRERSLEMVNATERIKKKVIYTYLSSLGLAKDIDT